MVGLYLLAVCAFTSAVGIWLGRRRGLSTAALSAAVGRVLECVGLAMVLLAVNVIVGVVAVLALRVLTGRFLSLYANADITLLVLSFLQALLLQAWELGEKTRPPGEG